MPIDYASEKFGSAIYSIVTSAVPRVQVENPLVAEYEYRTHLSKLDPVVIGSRFQRLRASVTRVQDKEQGSFRASANAMTDIEAHDWLVDFYNLAQDVEREYERGRAKSRR